MFNIPDWHSPWKYAVDTSHIKNLKGVLPIIYTSCPVPSERIRLSDVFKDYNLFIIQKIGVDRYVEGIGYHDLAHFTALCLCVLPPDEQYLIESIIGISFGKDVKRKIDVDKLVEEDADSHEYFINTHKRRYENGTVWLNGREQQLIESVPSIYYNEKFTEKLINILCDLDGVIRYTGVEVEATYKVLEVARDVLTRSSLEEDATIRFDFMNGELHYGNLADSFFPQPVRQVFMKIGELCKQTITGEYDEIYPELSEAREVLFLRNMRILLSRGWSMEEVKYRLGNLFGYVGDKSHKLDELERRFNEQIESGEIVRVSYYPVNEIDTDIALNGEEKDNRLHIYLPKHIHAVRH